MSLDDHEESNLTPCKKSLRIDNPVDSSSSKTQTQTPKMNKMAAPPVPNVQLRAKINKKINRSTSAWKSLSLSRRDKVKNDSVIFRSPSIYANEDEADSGSQQENSVMTRYLSGKMVPLTPSHQPTNVDHLVTKDLETDSMESESQPCTALVQAAPPSIGGNFCSVM